MIESSSSTIVRLTISGMTCASCVGRVERALSAVSGVRMASVNLATESAEVQTDGTVTTAALVAAAGGAGYGAAESVSATSRSQALHSTLQKQDQDAKQLRRSFLIAVLLTIPILVLEMGPTSSLDCKDR